MDPHKTKEIRNVKNPFKTLLIDILLSEYPKKSKIKNDTIAILNKGVTHEKG